MLYRLEKTVLMAFFIILLLSIPFLLCGQQVGDFKLTIELQDSLTLTKPELCEKFANNYLATIDSMLEVIQNTEDYVYIGRAGETAQKANLKMLITIEQQTEPNLITIGWYLYSNFNNEQLFGFFASDNSIDELNNTSKEDLIKLCTHYITLFLSLKVPPHSYIADPLNIEKEVTTVSINEYFGCKNCKNKHLAKVLTDYVNNMFFYRQKNAHKRKNRAYFNFYPNYRKQVYHQSQIEVKGYLEYYEKDDLYRFSLYFYDHREVIRVNQPVDNVITLNANLIENGDYTEFLAKASTIILSFYNRNF